MNRKKWIIYLILLGLAVGGILLRSYRIYRMPVTEPTLLERSLLAIGIGKDPVAEHVSRSTHEPQVSDGITHIVPLEELRGGGPGRDEIPSIDNPRFDSVIAADQYLREDGEGIAIEMNGRHRFYPYQILVWHEIVNDTLGDRPLLVTYGPLTRTGAVFAREMDGTQMEFGTADVLWNGSLVIYDRSTESLWSQTLGQAIVGERAGEALVPYPTEIVTWAKWRDAHPDGDVLSADTGMDRDYTRDPYAGTDQAILLPSVSRRDERLPAKTLVYGISGPDGTRKAYADTDIRAAGVINDQIGDRAVAIAVDPNDNGIKAFWNPTNAELRLSDDILAGQGDEVWPLNPQGIWADPEASLKARLPLERIAIQPGYWSSWAVAWPDTGLYLP